jgi:hypothetical protein
MLSILSGYKRALINKVINMPYQRRGGFRGGGGVAGADPGFQVRGGALKKIAPSGGRRENCWGIPCEKSRFYAKKIIFFQF